MTEAVKKRSRAIRALKWIGIGLVTFILGLIAIGTIWEYIERARVREAYPPPGKLVDIGGRKLHIDCRGTGSPTIIFESGLDTSGSLAWDRVHGPVSKQTRACAYDRAGVMWSDPKPGRQDAETVADDLHALLAAARIDGPIILVAHSIGGPYSMTYVRKYGTQVKGLVFVDASHPDQTVRSTPKMLALIEEHKDDFDPQTVLTKIAWSGALRALVGLSEPAPIPGMSERTATIGSAFLPATLGGSFKEKQSLETSLAQGGKLRDLGDRPLVVLTAQKAPTADYAAMGFSEQDGVDLMKQWKLLMAEEAGWSTRSRQVLVPDSGHFVQHARPDLVIEAVAEVVAAVRRGSSATQPASDGAGR